jgi:hypothetical protein
VSVAYAGVPRAPQSSSLADVLDVILDKGIVIDLYVRVSLVGIELVTIDARIVVASVDTYLRFAREVGRLQLGGGESNEKRGLPEAIGQMEKGGAEGKTEGAMQGIGESFRRWLPGGGEGEREGESAGQRRGQGGQQGQDDERGSRERRGEPSSASPSPPSGEARPPGEQPRDDGRPEEEASDRSPDEQSEPRGAAHQGHAEPDRPRGAAPDGDGGRPHEPEGARDEPPAAREEREDAEPELRVSGRPERRGEERERDARSGDDRGTARSFAGAPPAEGRSSGRGRGSRAVSPERRPPRGRVPVGR